MLNMYLRPMTLFASLNRSPVSCSVLLITKVEDVNKVLYTRGSYSLTNLNYCTYIIL